MNPIDIISNFFHYGISFIVIISAIVFIHEWGHFAVARFFGVKVDEFSIGFGKELYGWCDKRGTRWKICLLPLGGFVKMHGDASEASVPDEKALEKMSEDEKKISFHFKPLWQKALIVFAGPAINFILAITIYSGIYMSYGKLELKIPPVVTEVVEDSAAAEIGLLPGDRILTLDGKEIKYFTDLQKIIRISPLEVMEIQYERNGEVLSAEIAPKFHEQEDDFGNKARIGMIGIKGSAPEISEDTLRRLGFFESIGAAVEEVYSQCVTMLKGLQQIITGVRSTKELGGPVKILEYSGQSTSKISQSISCAFGASDAPLENGQSCAGLARDGFLIALVFMALISTMLGLVNLFPIPMLDGGHLAFYLIEAITRRPMAEKFQEWAFKLGFAFLITLMVYVTFNDIVSFVERHILS